MFVYNLEAVFFLSATKSKAQPARKNTIGYNNKELMELRNVGLHSLIAVYCFFVYYLYIICFICFKC